jgi:hypothetical protein
MVYPPLNIVPKLLIPQDFCQKFEVPFHALPLDFQPCASMSKTQDFVKPKAKPSVGQNKLPPYAKNARCDSDNQTGSINRQY